ncbi:hypothetical protein HDU96_001034, partial [Phlyctochytrium bullatum]
MRVQSSDSVKEQNAYEKANRSVPPRLGHVEVKLYEASRAPGNMGDIARRRGSGFVMEILEDEDSGDILMLSNAQPIDKQDEDSRLGGYVYPEDRMPLLKSLLERRPWETEEEMWDKRRLKLCERASEGESLLHFALLRKLMDVVNFLLEDEEYIGEELRVHMGRFIMLSVVSPGQLSEVLIAIKAALANALAQVDFPQLQLYDQRGQHITDLDDIPDDYYKKPKDGGLFLVIRIAPPPPSRQPTQPDLGSTFAAASPAITAFWAAFTNYSDTIEANTVVQLPENVFILGNYSIGTSMYIRPCYPGLFQTSLAIVQSADIQHLIILGNPGIGKTYFGYFLLLQLARSGATVVYESASLEGSLFLFTPNRVFKGTRFAMFDILMDSKTFYIVDGMEPLRAAAAKTILLSSLRKDIWHQFSKGPCDLRYMPVWSREEIFACRSMLYPSLSEDLVEDLYSKWGGIARYVLKFALVEEQQARLKEALDVSNIDAVVQSFGGTGEKADASSRLIHRSVRDGFHSGPYQFASAYVVDEIYSRVYAKDREHLIRFLSATQGIGDTGQLRGILFEKHAHTVLANGGSFKIRDLQTRQESTLQLPDDLTTFMYSCNDAEFQAAQNRYFRPVSKIFESVDSFIKPNLLFQMTGAKDHPCKQTGLRDVLHILGNPQEPKLSVVKEIGLLQGVFNEMLVNFASAIRVNKTLIQIGGGTRKPVSQKEDIGKRFSQAEPMLPVARTAQWNE